jgi:hypothetical protein
MKVFIDGNDGTGKTTLVNSLKDLGIPAFDRGWVSKKTLDPSIEPYEDSITIILDAPVEISRKQLANRGANLEEEYHTVESLTEFRPKYLTIAEQYSLQVIQHGKKEDTLLSALNIIWDSLSEYKRGESKILKRVGDVFLVKLIPSLYSYTNNRSAIIKDTEIERLKCHKKIVELLKENGIDHAHIYINPQANLIVSKYTEENPPMVETVVKAVHTGTPKHRYFNMYPDNFRYDKPYVRFDWRNPLRHPESNVRLADEVLCDELAAHFCNVEACRKTARAIWDTMDKFFKSCDIDMWDICFMLSKEGMCFSEISQDCMRAKPLDGTDTDKDCFRKGSDSEGVLKNYRRFNSLIGA